jgi:hypothetical protein
MRLRIPSTLYGGAVRVFDPRYWSESWRRPVQAKPDRKVCFVSRPRRARSERQKGSGARGLVFWARDVEAILGTGMGLVRERVGMLVRTV